MVGEIVAAENCCTPLDKTTGLMRVDSTKSAGHSEIKVTILA